MIKQSVEQIAPLKRKILAQRVLPAGAFVEFPKSEIEQSIASRFERQAEIHGARPAVKTQRHGLTYAALNRLANRIARAILTHAGPNHDRVALLTEHGASTIAAMLGALKAGKTYVPLDASFPQARNAYIVEDAKPDLVISESSYLALAVSLTAARIPVLNLDEVQSCDHEENPGLRVSPDQPCYILYTSGSTGQPKGVVQNHRNVLNDVRQYTNALKLGPEDRMTLLYSCSVNGSVRGIYGALLNAAALYPFNIKVEGLAGLAQLLESERITFYHSVPSVFRHFAATLTGGEDFSSLRVMRFGGERVLARDVELYKKYFPDSCLLYTGMGATETGHIAEFFSDKRTILVESVVPAGYPVEDKRVVLLDEAGQPVANGEVGEIAVQSPYLALGYWDKAELTCAAFLPAPNARGERIYLTGDFGRICGDGYLEHLGRKDFQVKVRGYRIEIAEVESTLLTHPALKEAAVVARPDLHGENQLVAYFVPAAESALRSSELRSFLSDKLPDYMLPAAYVALVHMPMTANGKLDRRALPAPDLSEDENREPFVAPRTGVERELVRIWCEVLKRECVGVCDNFFDLGGHSLLGAQVALRARGVFAVDIPLVSLFEAPTIAALAAKIESASPDGEGVHTPPILLASRAGDIELSFAQESFWFLEQLSPNSPLYNIARPIRIIGALNVDALRRGFETIAMRHESLRSVITVRDGRPIQAFAETAPALATIDLRALPKAKREIEAFRLAREDAKRPFTLVGGPLMRAALIRLDQDDHVLLLTLHHIISDAWSGGIFFNELNILYKAFSEHRPSPLLKSPLQYADVVTWQRRVLQGERLQRLLDYWKKQLAEIPPLMELPSDRPRPPLQTFAGARRFLSLPKRLVPALRKLSRENGVTLFMTLLAAFKALLSCYTRRSDIVVGTPIAGRTRPELEEVMGLFVNTLALRTDLSGDPTVRELLRRVREAALSAFAHEDLPFEKLVQELRPRRSLNHMPLCQVMFNLINSPPTTNVALAGLTLRPFDVDNCAATESFEPTHSTSFYSFSGTSKFDLTLFMWEDGDNLLGRIEYNTDLFDASTVVRLIGHYETLLAGMVASSESRLSQLPLLTPAERGMLLRDFNWTRADYQANVTISELFETQVEETPNATALIFGDRKLTYAEMNRNANRLALRLRDIGVGPEIVVGVYVERSLEMIVALLAVLKAGGAYLPLDREYPAQRLYFMLDDAKALALITERELGQRLKEHRAKHIYIDSLDRDDLGYPEPNLATSATPTNLAYVIYTSGSTGQPKGVMIEHRSVVNYFAAASRLYQLQRNDRVLQFASISFDVSVREIFASLTCGAAIVLCADPRQDAVRFFCDCQEWGITMLSLPTAYWHGLATDLDEGGLQIPPSLRLVSVGGEKMLADRLMIWRRAAPQLRLINSYGPTETTVSVTAWESRPGREVPFEVPIGRPIGNTGIYILDRHLHPVPIGVPGELHVGGAGLARGYLNRPELTAEKFIPNPFSGDPNARLYKTGDLARYLPDGNIEFLGRIDTQVKIRGFRIELGEIEAVLAKHPDVKACAVLARDDTPGDKRLVAYIVADENAPAASADLRAFLRRKLPDYMLPSAFIVLEQLPVTPSGKLDYRALPAPDYLGSEKAYVAPRTPNEQALAGIWAEVLKLDQIGIHDNFFDLGGHSLLATQVISRVKKTLDADIPLRALFESPTVAGLSALIVQSHAEGLGEDELAQLLSEAQEQGWRE